jgi:cytidylate kinase
MAIITISRGSYSRGKEVAEALAQRLNYLCVSRGILLEASEEFSVPEIKLLRALRDAPSVLDRLTHGKERYISYIRSTFLNHMVKDNVVYHGLAGHFFLQNIGHAFKVRINARMEDRIRLEMEREKCSEDEARTALKKADEDRRQWSLYLYGKDTCNCDLYDMVLSIDSMTVEDAVDILAGVVEKGRYDATPESVELLREQALLANIHAQIVNFSPETTVDIHDGVVTLSNLDGGLSNDEEIRRQTTNRLVRSFGLKDVVFDESLKAKKDYVNTFYNLDL